MLSSRSSRRGLFAFDHQTGTYLAHGVVGSTHASFSILASKNAEHTQFREYTATGSIELPNQKQVDLDTCVSFRVSEVSGKSILSFARKGLFHTSIETTQSDDLATWRSLEASTDFSRVPIYIDVPPVKRTRRIGAFVSSGYKHIDGFIGTQDFSHWEPVGTILEGRPTSFDATQLEPLVVTPFLSHVLLIYSAKDSNHHSALGAAILDRDNLSRVLWRASSPLFSMPTSWHEPATILGVSTHGKYATVFLERAGHPLESFPFSKLWETYRFSPAARRQASLHLKKQSGKNTVSALQLIRFAANPIIEPRTDNTWESMATFNTAALGIDDRVYLLYRAQGYDGHSVLGYAESHDGVTIHERLPYPIYDPSAVTGKPRLLDPTFARPTYMSGGGTGGCEDPRITRIDDTLYLIYTAFNGSAPPGVALTSLSVADFLAKRFHAWKKPRLLSRYGHIQKNWVIFPEKINGKIAILHNVSPRIMIELVDEIDAETLTIDSCPPRQGDNAHRWDNIVRGAGAPPIKTPEGWLVLYHAMDSHDPNKYKVGAMLLDLANPEIILARSLEPILEPEEYYENHGHKWGVVFVCGALVKDDTLYVYYGASDKTVAVATAPIKDFLSDLKAHKSPRVKTTRKTIRNT